MGIIELIGKVAPGWAARYTLNQKYFEAARLYEAATPSQWRPTVNNTGSGDFVMYNAKSRLRQIARHLEENHDIVVSLFDDLLNNVVGNGANITPMIRDRAGKLAIDVNKRLLEAWFEWGDYPEVTGELGFEQLERQVARHLFRDGEIFLRPVFSDRFNYKSNLNFVLEMVEADYCPFDANSEDGTVTAGIERNQWGAPSYYYFFKQHPGNIMHNTQLVNLGDLRRVAASGVYHLKFSRRIKQARGVPVIHAVIDRLRDLKDYEESERIAAKVAADFTFFIKKSSEFGAGNINTLNTDKKRAFSMSAGMGFELMPGEDVGTIQSNRPNPALVDFRAAMLRAITGGTGTRYSSVARDYNGTYSAQRQELVEGSIAYRVHFAYLMRRFYRPVWQDFVRSQVLAGNIPMRGIDPTTLFRVDCRAPAIPWIDPQKEAKAWRELVDAKLESRAEIMRQRNRDPQKVMEEMRQEADDDLFASAVEPVIEQVMPANEADEEQTDDEVAA